MDVSIVVPTHNRAALLERMLASLREVNVPSGITVELIVVASACTDHTLGVVRKAAVKLQYAVQAIDEPTPGVSLARNVGLRAARADLIAFLDDDVWVEREWLSALLATARVLPAGLFVGRVNLEFESSRPQWISAVAEGFLGVNNLGDEVQELVKSCDIRGANFAIRRSVIEQIGPFSLVLGRHGSELWSGEESELGERALVAGHRLFYVPGMVVRHWIPRERATVAHLKAVAFGRGLSRVLLRKTGSEGLLSCLRLGVAQALLGGTLALHAQLHRDDVRRVEATLVCYRGLGTLCALMQSPPGPSQGREGQSALPHELAFKRGSTDEGRAA